MPQTGAKAMKRKAIITLDFECQDFLEARVREAEIRRYVEGLRETFAAVDLRVTERRPRLSKRAETPRVYEGPRPAVN